MIGPRVGWSICLEGGQYVLAQRVNMVRHRIHILCPTPVFYFLSSFIEIFYGYNPP